MQVLTLWFETVHFTACVVLGFLVTCPFVPCDVAKADSEAEFNLAENSNEQTGLSDLNGNLMFHLLFFVVAVTESQWFGGGGHKNKSNFLCSPVSFHPWGF